MAVPNTAGIHQVLEVDSDDFTDEESAYGSGV